MHENLNGMNIPPRPPKIVNIVLEIKIVFYDRIKMYTIVNLTLQTHTHRGEVTRAKIKKQNQKKRYFMHIIVYIIVYIEYHIILT